MSNAPAISSTFSSSCRRNPVADEIEEITAYRFAGTLYARREDAEHMLAVSNLLDFIRQHSGVWVTAELLASHLTRHADDYIGLLKPFAGANGEAEKSQGN